MSVASKKSSRMSHNSDKWANFRAVNIKFLCSSLSSSTFSFYWSNLVTVSIWRRVEFQRVLTLAGMPLFLPNISSNLSLNAVLLCKSEGNLDALAIAAEAHFVSVRLDHQKQLGGGYDKNMIGALSSMRY